MSKFLEELQKAGPLLGLGAQIAAVMIVPVVAGYYIDRYYESSPWGIIIGMIAGFLAFFNLIWKLFIHKSKHSDSQDKK